MKSMELYENHKTSSNISGKCLKDTKYFKKKLMDFKRGFAKSDNPETLLSIRHGNDSPLDYIYGTWSSMSHRRALVTSPNMLLRSSGNLLAWKQIQ